MTGSWRSEIINKAYRSSSTVRKCCGALGQHSQTNDSALVLVALGMGVLVRQERSRSPSSPSGLATIGPRVSADSHPPLDPDKARAVDVRFRFGDMLARTGGMGKGQFEAQLYPESKLLRLSEKDS